MEHRPERPSRPRVTLQAPEPEQEGSPMGSAPSPRDSSNSSSSFRSLRLKQTRSCSRLPAFPAPGGAEAMAAAAAAAVTTPPWLPSRSHSRRDIHDKSSPPDSSSLAREASLDQGHLRGDLIERAARRHHWTQSRVDMMSRLLGYPSASSSSGGRASADGAGGDDREPLFPSRRSRSYAKCRSGASSARSRILLTFDEQDDDDDGDEGTLPQEELPRPPLGLTHQGLTHQGRRAAGGDDGPASASAPHLSGDLGGGAPEPPLVSDLGDVGRVSHARSRGLRVQISGCPEPDARGRPGGGRPALRLPSLGCSSSSPSSSDADRAEAAAAAPPPPPPTSPSPASPTVAAASQPLPRLMAALASPSRRPNSGQGAGCAMRGGRPFRVLNLNLRSGQVYRPPDLAVRTAGSGTASIQPASHTSGTLLLPSMPAPQHAPPAHLPPLMEAPTAPPPPPGAKRALAPAPAPYTPRPEAGRAPPPAAGTAVHTSCHTSGHTSSLSTSIPLYSSAGIRSAPLLVAAQHLPGCHCPATTTPAAAPDPRQPAGSCLSEPCAPLPTSRAPSLLHPPPEEPVPLPPPAPAADPDLLFTCRCSTERQTFALSHPTPAPRAHVAEEELAALEAAAAAAVGNWMLPWEGPLHGAAAAPRRPALHASRSSTLSFLPASKQPPVPPRPLSAAAAAAAAAGPGRQSPLALLAVHPVRPLSEVTVASTGGRHVPLAPPTAARSSSARSALHGGAPEHGPALRSPSAGRPSVGHPSPRGEVLELPEPELAELPELETCWVVGNTEGEAAGKVHEEAAEQLPRGGSCAALRGGEARRQRAEGACRQTGRVRARGWLACFGI